MNVLGHPVIQRQKVDFQWSTVQIAFFGDSMKREISQKPQNASPLGTYWEKNMKFKICKEEKYVSLNMSSCYQTSMYLLINKPRIVRNS